jgi:serine/threonine protein kinase
MSTIMGKGGIFPIGKLAKAQEVTSGQFLRFEIFGNYILLKRLAAGGMAEVFLARPASPDGNGRVLVIKRILPHIADNPMFVEMFHDEVQVLLGFNHPHTVQLHDFGEVNRQPYIAMELIEGKNLREILRKFGKQNERMPVPMALSQLAQAAAGLSYAHNFENKVTGAVVKAIHRDVSPQNLLQAYNGNLKVIDFGIAKAKSEIREQTQVGVIRGKIAYLSPEQIRGQSLDGRSDIFALGVVAWELLTFARPFCQDGDPDAVVLRNILNCDKSVLPPSALNPEVPKEVDAVILKALRLNSDERFAEAAEFQSALREVLLRCYPNYTYANTGEIMRALFEEEISQEREEVRVLNEAAQRALVMPKKSRSKGDGSTTESHSMMIEASGDRIGQVTRIPLTKSSIQGVGDPLKTLSSEHTTFEIPPAKVPRLLKKAIWHNGAVIAILILMAILIKLDNRYGLVNRFSSHYSVADRKALTRVTRMASMAKPVAPPTSVMPVYPKLNQTALPQFRPTTRAPAHLQKTKEPLNRRVHN